MSRPFFSYRKLAFTALGQLWIGVCAACLFGFFHWPLVKAHIAVLPAVCLYFSGGYLITKLGLRKKSLIVGGIQLLLSFLLFYLSQIPLNIYFLAISIILTCLYNGFWFPVRLRENLWLKNITIGAVWAATLFSVNDNLPSLWVFPAIIFFIAGILVAYDIRDSKWDRIETLPRKFGIKVSKKVGWLNLILSLPFVFIAGHHYFLPWLLTVLMATIFIHFADAKKPWYYFSIMGEFLCALPLLFSLVLPNFTLCF